VIVNFNKSFLHGILCFHSILRVTKTNSEHQRRKLLVQQVLRRLIAANTRLYESFFFHCYSIDHSPIKRVAPLKLIEITDTCTPLPLCSLKACGNRGSISFE
jgi:hypothetical protein